MKMISMLLCMFCLACRSGTSVKAYIYERVEVNTNQIKIKYRYVVEGQEHTDSAIVQNKVIDADSITVTISGGKAEPQIR